MNQDKDILLKKIRDAADVYSQSSRAKDRDRMHIYLNREEYEQNLDDMWAIYGRGVPSQIIEYNKGLNDIKSVGLKVLRNSSGKHKIVLK